MKRGQCYYEEIINALKRAHRCLPQCTMGQHLGTALDGWGDVCSLEDREILSALKKYMATMEVFPPREDVSDIIKEGMRIQSVIIEDRYDNEDNE
jgi:hypothetical protein